MPKAINVTIGHAQCRIKGCNQRASIRRNKNHETGARYLHCPIHGTDRVFGKHQQALDAWIDANTLAPISPKPKPQPPGDFTPAPTPNDPQAKPKKGGGFWSWFEGGDNE